MTPPTPPDYELHYRDALATVRALVADDAVAAACIAKHADPAGCLLADIAGVSLFLLTSNVPNPLHRIDALFDRVPEALAEAAARRQQRNGDGAPGASS